MCVRGSESGSMMLLSISVSSPESVELHGLFELSREVTHEARELVEDDRYRDHARVAHGLLHSAGELFQGVGGLHELFADQGCIHASGHAVRKAGNVRLVQDQLRHKAPQLVELARVDADGGFFDGLVRRGGFASGRGFPAREAGVSPVRGIRGPDLRSLAETTREVNSLDHRSGNLVHTRGSRDQVVSPAAP